MKDKHEMTVPAEPSSMERIRSSFGPVLAGWEPESADEILLALVECASNVVQHRDPDLGEGCIRIEGEREARKLRFRICDFCKEGEIPAVRPRELAEVRPGGLGTHFVNEIMSRVFYESDGACEGAVSLILELDLSSRGEEN